MTDLIIGNHPKDAGRCVRCHDSVGHGATR
jgi:hypothetical protein